MSDHRESWRADVVRRCGQLLLLFSLLVAAYVLTRATRSVDLAAYVCMILAGAVAVWATGLGVRVRGAVLVCALLFAGGVAARSLGMVPGSVLCLSVAAVLSTILFGSRAGWLALAVSSAELLILGASGRAETTASLAGELLELSSWYRMAAVYALFTGALLSLVAGALWRVEASLAEARASAERLRRMSEATFEGISITDEEVIVDANQQFASMHGYALPELIGTPVAALVVPQDRPRIAHAILQQLTAAYRVTRLRKDGTTFPADVRGRPLELADRRLRIAAVRDLSEQTELLERLALIGRATNDALWDWDLRSGEMWWSEGIQTLFGYASHDVRPEISWWSERIHPEDRARVDTGIAEAVAARRQQWSDEYRFHRAEGGYADVFDRGFLVIGPEGVPQRMVGAMLDVTERKRIQKALHRSERMATVGGLIAGVAHEVRQPLFGISANLDAYEAELHEPEARRELLEQLRIHVNRLSELMNDLLEYGRPPGLKLVQGGLEGVIRGALRNCARRAEQAGVSLSAELGGNASEVLRDPGRLEQVFENLLSNAVSYSSRGGSVRVRLESVAAPQPSVSCCVEDDGPGIQKEDFARLFDPFFSRRKGGTGLGLAIVQRIVEEHGGTVRAANRTGGGAAFTVVLPAVARATRRSEPGAA